MIMAKGVRYLALAKWGNLESLSLNGNFFKDEGIQYLSTGKWPRLQRLKLGGFDDSQTKTNSRSTVPTILK